MPFVPVGTRPATWFVCFHATSPTWWVQRFIPGPWKHVNCFGHVPGQNLWLFYNFAFDGGEVAVIPDNQARMRDAQMAPFIDGARVLEYHPPAVRQRNWQPIATCVSEVASLIGTRSRALRAGVLMRDLLAEQAKIIQWEPGNAGIGPTAAADVGSGGDGETGCVDRN